MRYRLIKYTVKKEDKKERKERRKRRKEGKEEGRRWKGKRLLPIICSDWGGNGKAFLSLSLSLFSIKSFNYKIFPISKSIQVDLVKILNSCSPKNIIKKVESKP